MVATDVAARGLGKWCFGFSTRGPGKVLKPLDWNNAAQSVNMTNCWRIGGLFLCLGPHFIVVFIIIFSLQAVIFSSIYCWLVSNSAAAFIFVDKPILTTALDTLASWHTSLLRRRSSSVELFHICEILRPWLVWTVAFSWLAVCAAAFELQPHLSIQRVRTCCRLSLTLCLTASQYGIVEWSSTWEKQSGGSVL